MTFLFCSAPLMYFDKPGSDLLCAIAARHCTLPFPTGDFLTRPSNYITPVWYLVSHQAFELEEPSAEEKERETERETASCYWLLIFLLNLRLKFGQLFMK